MIYELLGAETNLTVSTVSTEGDDPDADDPKVEDPEVDIVLIESERKSCFHIAVFWSSDGIENAECVCAQQVLYRTTEDSPDLYFAVITSIPRSYTFTCLVHHHKYSKTV
jgi:hypothetical protein